MNSDFLCEIQDLIDAGRTTELRPMEERLLAENPTLATAIWGAVQQLFQRGAADLALELAVPLHTRHIDNPKLHITLALGYFRHGETVNVLADSDEGFSKH